MDPAGILEGYLESATYDPPAEDKLLLGMLQQRLQEAYQVKQHHEYNWEVYRRYLKGAQFTVHRSSPDNIYAAVYRDKKLRSHYNVCRPTARAYVGKLSQAIPSAKVVPATADFQEKHAAKAADALLAYLERKECLPIKYVDSQEYLPWAGNAILRLYWDTLAGKVRAWCETCEYDGAQSMVGAPCPKCTKQREDEEALVIQKKAEAVEDVTLASLNVDGSPVERLDDAGLEAAMDYQPELEQLGPLELGRPIPTLQDVREGDVCVKLCNIYGTYVNPGATSIQNAEWICHRNIVTVQEARRMFPEMAAFIGATNLDSTHSYALLSQSLEAHGNQEVSDHVVLDEWHTRPTELYPTGQLVWVVNEEMIVSSGPNPYFELLGRFPFFQQGADQNPGEFWYEPPMAQAWHLQRELDFTQTAIREMVELNQKPKIFVPMQAGIGVTELNSQNDQVVLYNGTSGPPIPWQPPRIPPDLWERAQTLPAAIREAFGVTTEEVGLTSANPNGRAMAILNAEADKQLGPMIKRNNEEWRQLLKGMLILAINFYSPTRTWTITGTSGTEMYYINSINLNPGWDLVLSETDSLSRNPAVRLQEAMQLAGTGIYNNGATGQFDPKAFARHAQLNIISEGYDIEQTERAAAASIPEILKRGGSWTPRLFDDPKIFAEVLVGWLRGSRNVEPPELVMQVEQIWQFYAMMSLQAALPGMGMMGAMQPQGSGQPGTPPGPEAGVMNDSQTQAEAAQTVKGADAAGEAAVRGGQGHEY